MPIGWADWIGEARFIGDGQLFDLLPGDKFLAWDGPGGEEFALAWDNQAGVQTPIFWDV